MRRRVALHSAWIGATALLCALPSMARGQGPAAPSANQTGELSSSSTTAVPAEAPADERLSPRAAGFFSPNASPLIVPRTPTEVAARRAAGVARTATEGSVLRLVAGVQGVVQEPGDQLPEPIPPPDPSLSPGSTLTPTPPTPMPPEPSPSEALYNADGVIEPPNSMQDFMHSRGGPIADEYTGPPPRRPLLHCPPPGIIPFFGPRTSEQDRFIGWGEPLYGASWLNRPLGAGWFAGFMQGSHPILGLVGQHGGFFGGYRFTWDYDYYYGLEARLGGGAIGLKYPGYDYPTATSDLYVADINVLYYPLGDARWRPFLSLGLGTTKISFYDREDAYYGGVLVSLPFGVGLKYRWREWLALRCDIMDNLAFGRGPFNTMNNVSYTGGVEIRFGGLRKTYYPWHPSRQIW